MVRGDDKRVAAFTRRQRVMIVQVPSEANGEKLLNTRLGDAQAEGWHIASMMDHNGFLVWLLERGT